MFQITHTSRQELCDVLWMFDLDHTLIKPKYGKFATSAVDYVWLRCPKTNAAVDIMIYSNQSKPHEGFLEKAKEVCEAIQKNCKNANIYFFAAFEKDQFRKPCSIGLLAGHNMSMYKYVIFIGDAAGRPDDFADTDYKFAVNLGAQFLVPEAFDTFTDDYDDIRAIKKHVRRSEKNNIDQINSGVFYIDWDLYSRANNIERYQKILLPILNKKIIMCGRQGSGKTTFAEVAKSMGMKYVSYESKKDMSFYITRRQDGLIIDGTFPKKDTRKIAGGNSEYVVIYMNTPIDVCQHNRLFRELVHGEQKIPDIAVRIFNKHFEEPTGTNVIVVPFMIDENASKDYFKYYY